jgi:hypothetical protein
MRLYFLLSLASLGCTPPAIDPDTAHPETAGPTDTASPWDMSLGAEIYDGAVLHQVQVELDPDDWDELRTQQRNLLSILTGDCLDEPFEAPYTYFHADVTVDGERYDDVGIRKKGLLGSESSENPSLKIRFDEYTDDVLHDGVDRLTLNNGRQDPAIISQCLGYELFRDAGVPASRCSFAAVSVNGVDLGVYSNVEAVEPPMLARWFEDPRGRLWEGQLSDFRQDWLGTFERQEGDGDTSILHAVADALERPDDQVMEAIDEHIDLAAYHRFWAMEVLLGHWDGYAGNSNNYFVYQDPADGRLDFLPWGIDALFDSSRPFGSTRPTSVVAVTALPRRLYLLDQGRGDYRAQLLGLLDEVWDEDAIQARIDAMEALVLPAADPDGSAGVVDAVAEIRDYVGWRRFHIETELEGGDPGWSEGLRGDPCLVDLGELPVSFETTWGSYGTQDWASYGSGSMGFVYNGVDYGVEFLGVVAGEAHGDGTLLALGRVEWGGLLALLMNFPLDLLVDGTSFTMDWSQGQAYLYYDESGTGEGFAVAAYLGHGPVVFEQANAAQGATFSGSVDLNVYGGQ